MTVVNLQRKKNLPAGRGIAWWIDWSVNDWPIAALSAPIIQTIDSGAKLLLSGVRFPLHLLAFENWFESMLNSERLIRINWQTDTHARTHTRRSTENCFTSLAFRCHWNWMKCRPTNFRWAIQINSVHWRFMKAQIKPINVKPEFQIQIRNSIDSLPIDERSPFVMMKPMLWILFGGIHQHIANRRENETEKPITKEGSVKLFIFGGFCRHRAGVHCSQNKNSPKREKKKDEKEEE